MRTTLHCVLLTRGLCLQAQYNSLCMHHWQCELLHHCGSLCDMMAVLHKCCVLWYQHQPVADDSAVQLLTHSFTPSTAHTIHTTQQLLQLVITDIAIVVLTRNSVFQYSNKSLLFFWLLSVSLAIIAFCFLVATFFSRAKVSVMHWVTRI
jgi:hypothetical protein